LLRKAIVLALSASVLAASSAPSHVVDSLVHVHELGTTSPILSWSPDQPPPQVSAQTSGGSGQVGYKAKFVFPTGTVVARAICPDGYANQCGADSSNPANCYCFIASGVGRGSTFGKSISTSLEITVDAADSFDDVLGFCAPSWGELFITGTKEDETVALSGASCFPLGLSLPFLFNGGFEFAAPSTVFSDAFGPSTSGEVVHGQGFVMRLKGVACKQGAPCTQN